MTVRLIAVSRPAGEFASTPSELLAYCARVSNTANQANHETGGKLLRSLVRRKEWSPFEMVSVTMEIVTTRDIARQMLRHRSFSFQEFSQRYAAVEGEPVFREARMQHPTDRQASINGTDPRIAKFWCDAQGLVAWTAQRAYEDAIANGIAKEVARAVLPEGMTVSTLFMSGTLRSWLHYVGQRTEAATQKEHRLIAQECADVLRGEFPDLTDLIGGSS